MASPHELLKYKSFLVAYGGGYLRTRAGIATTPATTAPASPGIQTSSNRFQCSHQYAPSHEASDRRGFVSYGWDHSQSATVMYGYKDAIDNRQAQRLVNVMLF